ncbi:ThiF family adenylyltransferase [Sphingomonas sp. ASV193]|uniref:ThiF family adenylyltransferase n=1 Tax=Sphingomonas sp. ASV193 TaxID=3144405 RepID=UPI0032E86E01
MSALRFAAPAYAELTSALLADAPLESCGVAFAKADPDAGTWLVRDAQSVPEEAYEVRTETSATLRPAYLIEVANRARPTGDSVVLIHTHPFTRGTPSFSPIDDAGEVELAEYFGRRASTGFHLAMVVGPNGCRARRLGTRGDIPVWEVGATLACRSGAVTAIELSEIHDRQVRAFGRAGQQILAGLRVGIVGAGGTGSVIAQELAHLGVLDFLVIDPDRVERTNLNRLVGAHPEDVGNEKVSVARSAILSISPAAQVTGVVRDVVDADVAALLRGLDFIFLCTDSHASRAVVGQFAYQFLVPTIDMGVSVTVKEGEVTHISGRVQMLAPGLPCLACTSALDGEQIRREMLTPELRASDPYIIGVHEPQPAVISINATMASLAITMFMGAVTGMPAHARFQLYDGIRGTVRPTTARIVSNCIVCSSEGALARGPSWPLPVRPAAFA